MIYYRNYHNSSSSDFFLIWPLQSIRNQELNCLFVLQMIEQIAVLKINPTTCKRDNIKIMSRTQQQRYKDKLVQQRRQQIKEKLYALEG